MAKDLNTFESVPPEHLFGTLYILRFSYNGLCEHKLFLAFVSFGDSFLSFVFSAFCLDLDSFLTDSDLMSTS